MIYIIDYELFRFYDYDLYVKYHLVFFGILNKVPADLLSFEDIVQQSNYKISKEHKVLYSFYKY